MAFNHKQKTKSMSWFLAENDNQQGQYVSGLDQSGQPIWTDHLEEAAWSAKKPPVDRFIEQNNLQNVTSKSIGGNHPGSKPPLA